MEYRVIWGNDKYLDQSSYMSLEDACKLFDEKELGFEKCHWVYLMCESLGDEYWFKQKYIKDQNIMAHMPKPYTPYAKMTLTSPKLESTREKLDDELIIK